MFSRTTIASSINRPMHSDSAINVRKLSVKPMALSTMKVAITEIGSVRPVMIVERQLCRNRNTISTVSRPPSRIVRLTLSSEALMPSALDQIRRISTSSGRRFLSSSRAASMPLPTSMMLEPCTRNTERPMAGSPLTRASEVRSSSPSTISATCERYTGVLATCATMIAPKASGDFSRPSTRTRRSSVSVLMLPAGRS